MSTDMPVKYEVLDITPDVALSILEGNTHNRNIRQRVVDKYAADMRNGDWQGENGQSIVIAPDSRVVDGQHRLWAIAQSETTQRVLVVSNVDMSAQVNMDTQAKRSFGDVLKLEGEPHATLLAAVVRRVWGWERGIRSSGGHNKATHAQLLDTLTRHPSLRDSATVAQSTRPRLAVHGSTLGLCHWLFQAIDLEDCDHFFSLIRGEHDGLKQTHPVRVLHEMIARGASPKNKRLTEMHAAAYVIKAWNAYRDGRDVNTYTYRPGGANPESFPEPR